MKTTDVLVIGSGIAGISTAIRLAQNPRRKIILLTSSSDLHESNTFWAQGGIVHRGRDDSAELLIKDILVAGAGASLPESARIVAEEGPRLVEEVLIGRARVEFDREADGTLAYGQEAAHSRRRIVHVRDETGAAVSTGLVSLL
jgi:L-aspartate oxidase